MMQVAHRATNAYLSSDFKKTKMYEPKDLLKQMVNKVPTVSLEKPAIEETLSVFVQVGMHRRLGRMIN